jgi:GT2 family glycosyltransferase
MLCRAVDSLLTATRVPSEIVIVDQSLVAQPELDRGTVRGCAVRYVHSSTRGLSQGRNLGIQLASLDVVVVLDDDMVVQDDSLERLVAAHDGPGSRIVTTGRLLAAPPDRPGVSQPPAALVTRTRAETFRGRQPFQVVPGPNIALTRSVMLEIGGYDERLGAGTRFPSAEDHDLSLRLLDAGCEVRHVPDAVVLHLSWRSRTDRLRLRWAYARGVGGFYAKHASLRDPYVLRRVGVEVRERLGRAVSATLSSPATTGAQLVSLAGLLWGAIEWSVRYRLTPLRRRPASTCV